MQPQSVSYQNGQKLENLQLGRSSDLKLNSQNIGEQIVRQQNVVNSFKPDKLDQMTSVKPSKPSVWVSPIKEQTLNEMSTPQKYLNMDQIRAIENLKMMQMQQKNPQFHYS